MRKTLGVNISHDCSFAFFENGVLKEYYEEARFNKIKHFKPVDPFYQGEYKYKVLEKFNKIIFDAVVFISHDRGNILIEKAYIDNILKQIKYNDVKFYFKNHHLCHATCGYYFSEFKEATAIITDGGGELIEHETFEVMESIFKINDKEIIKYYQQASNQRSQYFQDWETVREKNIKDKKFNFDLKLTNQPIGGYKYMLYKTAAGFKEHEEGQLMGIAAYKDKQTNLNKKVLEIAHEAQEKTLQERIQLIEKALSYSNCSNIILSGGYHLNCANNFKIVKHFPKLKFFVDPIPYDGGTAVGAAYYYENY
jgi:predicted NodU family carbamoyl transferase|tara:strand:+ start:212 stop:1138 length:927 start_codon:yes stop_codon:yes gene_type:complete